MVYWGYDPHPLTNHLLTSWDIQVNISGNLSHFVGGIQWNTSPETNISPEHLGWKMSFLLEWRSSRCYVSFREGIVFVGDLFQLFVHHIQRREISKQKQVSTMIFIRNTHQSNIIKHTYQHEKLDSGSKSFSCKQRSNEERHGSLTCIFEFGMIR